MSVPSRVEFSTAARAGADRAFWTGDLTLVACLAIATVVVHVLSGGKYGFQRDELATLEDARHLAWGYVAYPPVTPFFGRLSLELFGTSLAPGLCTGLKVCVESFEGA